MTYKPFIFFLLVILSSSVFAQTNTKITPLEKFENLPAGAFDDGCAHYFTNETASPLVTGQGNYIFASNDSTAFLKINGVFVEFTLIDKYSSKGTHSYRLFKNGAMTLRTDIQRTEGEGDMVVLYGRLILVTESTVIQISVVGGYDC